MTSFVRDLCRTFFIIKGTGDRRSDETGISDRTTGDAQRDQLEFLTPGSDVYLVSEVKLPGVRTLE